MADTYYVVRRYRHIDPDNGPRPIHGHHVTTENLSEYIRYERTVPLFPTDVIGVVKCGDWWTCDHNVTAWVEAATAD